MKTIRRLPPIVYVAVASILSFGGYQLWQIFHPTNLTDRSSSGERILIAPVNSNEKTEGIKSFAKGDYQSAIQHFQVALNSNPNDPEARIYLNNSIARSSGKKNSKIAIVIPIGSNINVAQEILRGVAHVETDTNKRGGINGIPIEVEILDDENNPNLAREIADKLSKDPDILAVIGSNTSDASLAAAPIYQRAGVVMITPTSMGDNLSGIGNYIFRTVPTSQALAHTLADRIYTVDRHRKLALCIDTKASDNISFKDEIISEFSRLGGKLVNFNCDVAASDFNPSQAIDTVISNGGDALFVSSHVDRPKLALQVAQANHSRLPLYSSPSLNTFNTLDAAYDFAGLTLVTPWLNPIPTPSGSFSDRAQKLWRASVNWRTALTYDAASAIVTGLKKSNGTRAGLQQALHSSNFSAVGAAGEIKFQSNGDREIVPTLAQIQQVNGKWVFASPTQPIATPMTSPTQPTTTER